MLVTGRPVSEIPGTIFINFPSHFLQIMIKDFFYKKGKELKRKLIAKNSKEFAILGIGEVAEHLYSLTKNSSLQIKGVYDISSGGSFHDMKVSPVEDLAGYSGKAVLGTHDGHGKPSQPPKKLWNPS
jgi:hypothetical protein